MRMCVWLAHSSRRSNDDNMNRSNATIEHIPSDVIPGIRSIR